MADVNVEIVNNKGQKVGLRTTEKMAAYLLRMGKKDEYQSVKIVKPTAEAKA